MQVEIHRSRDDGRQSVEAPPPDGGWRLSVRLESPSTDIVVGRAVLVVVRVIASSDAPAEQTVSSRLNLWEGDLSIRREQVPIAGGSGEVVPLLDTGERQVILQPGDEIVVGLNLLCDRQGYVFPVAGSYVLRAVYRPARTAPEFLSEPVTVVARPPASAPERAIAALLRPEGSWEKSMRPSDAAIALCQADPRSAPAAARQVLEELVHQVPDTPEGVMAALLLAAVPARRASPYLKQAVAADEAPVQDELPKVEETLDRVHAAGIPAETLAHWLVALETPFNPARGDLGERFAHWRRQAGSASDSKERPDRETRIARLQPVTSTTP